MYYPLRNSPPLPHPPESENLKIENLKNPTHHFTDCCGVWPTKNKRKIHEKSNDHANERAKTGLDQKNVQSAECALYISRRITDSFWAFAVPPLYY